MKHKTILAAAACLIAAGCGDQGSNEAAVAEGGNAAAAGNAAAPQAGRSILDSLTASQDHSTLVNAVKAAGLTETLSGPTPYTVFAPTNAAFQSLPGTTANDLLSPDAKGRLVAVLTGHIVPGTVTSQDLARAMERGNGKAELATVGGTTLSFSREGDAMLVSDGRGQGRIAAADMLQSNGVVHSVDTVLMPAV
ncbi:MAG: fasciclin domain-containing protein [Allosphingosinicella sp.]